MCKIYFLCLNKIVISYIIADRRNKSSRSGSVWILEPLSADEDLLKENLIRLRQIETCYYELRLADKTEELEDISSLLKESREKFDAALNDDFNTSLGLSVFFNMIKTINSLAADEKISKKIAVQALPVLEYMLEVLGIEIQTVSDEEIESVFELINKRETLREEKQFEEADKIRDQIAGLGISLIDHKNKTLWMKKEAIKSEKQWDDLWIIFNNHFNVV